MKAAIVLLSLAAGALAGSNCKCQAADGTGPQWDDATKACCSSTSPGGILACIQTYHGDQHHQCSASGCIDSGEFVKCCQNSGAPSAYCWN